MAGDNGRFIPFKIRCAVTSMTIEVRTRPIISKPMVQDYILPTVVHLIMFQRHMYRRVCRVAGINKGLKRSIFSDRQLTINKYVAERQMIVRINSPESIAANRHALAAKISKRCVEPSVFCSKFPTFLYSIEDTAEDSELLLHTLDKLNQAGDDSVNLPKLGLIVMRALHYLHNDTIAQQIYKDLATTELFQRTKSNLIYFNLLYKKAKYGQVIEDAKVHIARMHADQQWKLSRSISLQIYAACYQQNSNQSFEYAKCLHSESRMSFASREYLVYLGALALAQNSPSMAEEYLREAWPVQHSALLNLRLKAVLQCGRASEAIHALSSALTCYGDSYEKLYLSKALIDYATSTFPKYAGEQLQREFELLVSKLHTNGNIIDKSIDDMLLELTQSERSHELSAAYNQKRYRRYTKPE